MSRHALVLNGEMIADPRDFEPNVDQSELAEGKPRWLPVDVEEDAFDPVTQVREGPTYEVEAARVVEHYTSRAKNEDEIAAMKADKDAAIEAEFHRLYNLPIAYTVGGTEYTFHADDQARENITGVLMAYREAADLGLTLPDPRPWTLMNVDAPVSISRAELAGLGIAIAARKDALFTVKKVKQAALATLTDPAAINAVNPLSGWEIA